MYKDIQSIIVIAAIASKRVCRVQTSASFDEAKLRTIDVLEDTTSGLKEDQSPLVEEADENKVNGYCCSTYSLFQKKKDSLHDLGVACTGVV